MHDTDPPMEGGSRPVKQEPPYVPPSRRSPMPVILIVVVAVILLAGLAFIFSH